MLGKRVGKVASACEHHVDALVDAGVVRFHVWSSGPPGPEARQRTLRREIAHAHTNSVLYKCRA
jgi:hypothetical protein